MGRYAEVTTGRLVFEGCTEVGCWGVTEQKTHLSAIKDIRSARAAARNRNSTTLIVRESLDRVGFKTAHTPHPCLCGQFVQQCLGVFEVGGIEAFGEPAINLGEHRARFVATGL